MSEKGPVGMRPGTQVKCKGCNDGVTLKKLCTIHGKPKTIMPNSVGQGAELLSSAAAIIAAASFPSSSTAPNGPNGTKPGRQVKAGGPSNYAGAADDGDESDVDYSLIPMKKRRTVAQETIPLSLYKSSPHFSLFISTTLRKTEYHHDLDCATRLLNNLSERESLQHQLDEVRQDRDRLVEKAASMKATSEKKRKRVQEREQNSIDLVKELQKLLDPKKVKSDKDAAKLGSVLESYLQKLRDVDEAFPVDEDEDKKDEDEEEDEEAMEEVVATKGAKRGTGTKSKGKGATKDDAPGWATS